MAWLTNGVMWDRMAIAAEVTWGSPVADWWRDEPALWAWWRQHGWSEKPREGTGGIVIGRNNEGQDVVVWLYLSGRTSWAIDGLGVHDGGPLWRLWNAPNRPQCWINPFNAHDRGGTPKTGAIDPGGWIGWMDGDRINIGKAVTVNMAGNAVLIEIAPGEVVARDTLASKRVFPLRGRDVAMQWFYERGETSFSHYSAFVSKLYHKWLKLTGTPMPPRNKRHPRPSLMRPQGAERAPAPEEHSVKAARLRGEWQARMVERDAIQHKLAATPNDQAANDAFYKADEAVELAGKAYAEAETVWAKAVIEGDG